MLLGRGRSPAQALSGTQNLRHSQLELKNADCILRGATYDSAGSSLAGPHDLDGDGFADLLVGAPGNRARGLDAGAVYFVPGTSLGAGGTLTLGTANLMWTAEDTWDLAGRHVSLAGDVNGDGATDLLIGAPGHGSVSSPKGAAYLLFNGF